MGRSDVGKHTAFDKVLGKIASAPPPASVKQRKAAIKRRKK